MAQPVVVATVKIADVEPFATFITRVCKAESFLWSLTKEEVAALPAGAAAAMGEIQTAVRDLGAARQAQGQAADADDDPFSLERFQASHVPGTRPPRF